MHFMDKKLLLSKFFHYTEKEFLTFCKKSNKDPDIYNYTKYLIDHKVIELLTIKRYAVLKEFSVIYPLCDEHKTNTVKKLSKIFKIPVRTLWSILKDHSKRFD